MLGDRTEDNANYPRKLYDDFSEALYNHGPQIERNFGKVVAYEISD